MIKAATPEAADFEVWIVECMMIRGYSLQWEVIRLHGENADLWGRLNETEAKYRLVSMQIEELKANGRSPDPAAPLDGDFRRLRGEQAEQAKLLRGLVGQVSTLLEELPTELAMTLEDARLTKPEGLPSALEAGAQRFPSPSPARRSRGNKPQRARNRVS